MANIGRKPDYTLSVFVKDTDPQIKGRCGVAWQQDDGSVQIKLDATTVLQGPAYVRDMLITLFPTDEFKARKRTEERKGQKPAPKTEPTEDDIPF